MESLVNFFQGFFSKLSEQYGISEFCADDFSGDFPKKISFKCTIFTFEQWFGYKKCNLDLSALGKK